MSLDVSLIMKKDKLDSLDILKKSSSGIFVRENGQTKEVSEAEWYEKNPGVEPVRFISSEDNDSEEEVYSANITHNLNKMAEYAGIYYHLWKPKEINVDKASELVAPLTKALAKMDKDPEHFKQFNPKNGWGDFEGFYKFVFNYLDACRKFPEAKIEVSN